MLSILAFLAESLLILLVCYLLCFSFCVLAACDTSCAEYKGICLKRLSVFRRVAWWKFKEKIESLLLGMDDVVVTTVQVGSDGCSRNT